MPLLIQENIKPAGELGIWQISEPKEFFNNAMTLTDAELEKCNRIKGNLQIEWLASRYLLHQLSGREKRGKLNKDEYGKPYLQDSDHHISMSHSRNMAAVIASPIVCGIDIQLIVPKIERIAPKFMNKRELDSLADNPINHMHLYWGAKECLYKSYGKRKLDFKSDILIDPFTLHGDNGSFSGSVIKDDFSAQYQLHFQRYDDYILVYSLQLNDNA